MPDERELRELITIATEAHLRLAWVPPSPYLTRLIDADEADYLHGVSICLQWFIAVARRQPTPNTRFHLDHWTFEIKEWRRAAEHPYNGLSVKTFLVGALIAGDVSYAPDLSAVGLQDGGGGGGYDREQGWRRVLRDGKLRDAFVDPSKPAMRLQPSLTAR